jgi:hypothetical protein
MQLTQELLADIALALDRPELKSYTLLDRPQTSIALTVLGYPIAPATLETRASRPTADGSPPYRKFNRRVLYRLQDVVDWAGDRTVYRTGPPRLPPRKIPPPIGTSVAVSKRTSTPPGPKLVRDAGCFRVAHGDARRLSLEGLKPNE